MSLELFPRSHKAFICSEISCTFLSALFISQTHSCGRLGSHASMTVSNSQSPSGYCVFLKGWDLSDNWCSSVLWHKYVRCPTVSEAKCAIKAGVCVLTSWSCAAASSRAWSGASPDTPEGSPALLLGLSGAAALNISTHTNNSHCKTSYFFHGSHSV